ncbi:heme-binding protein [Cryptosporangium arvum]|uniref:Uncharacterized protein n=1 Tax=Cryptosporangium arvum DSM 44712 TaxID=927661 RepID=A0A010Z698_9ACTN|nr:heme-binding protein [Cryptosporangium arvum]EXG82818.1 hypothetical protein CryarDRAFT_4019 [Cryptosporangium arvum DSM 44712]
MTDIEPVLEQTRGFRWGEVPADRHRRRAAVEIADPDLGGIAGFRGTFRGTGLNTIFRPQNFGATPTPLLNPASGPDDNVLEINLTEETLSFSQPLGSIPNRGMVQGDIFLNGIPYLQSINDVTDPGQAVGIHFEPGIWLSVPATTVPALPPTVARMASIPHGTTIEAQGTTFTVAGGPTIAPVDITPFPVGSPGTPIKFPSQTAAATDTFRIPQDLSPFIAAGTITQEILDNPNVVLTKRADAQTITSTTVIVVSTDPASPVFGGGADNIAFLKGDTAGRNPNADAVTMSSIFWVETVTETITVRPPGAGFPVIVRGSGPDPAPSFRVNSAAPITRETTVEVSYVQIQYTQTVLLNFNGLSWPHVSVATLVPAEPVPVTI